MVLLFFQQTVDNQNIGKLFHHYLIIGLLESKSYYFPDLDRTGILDELTP